MPRYMIEREFSQGLDIPVTPAGAEACLGVVGVNAKDGVTWVHSYVSLDKKKTFCVYDAPSPEAVRRVAAKNQLPVGLNTVVRGRDPYFYRCDPGQPAHWLGSAGSRDRTTA